ncbi:MAG: 2-C-methyl-D-erythritol 4-phosphate cytidylyltransferase [Ruminococcaceae bacterium]|nr:2-C-methyl-D-erythritol 4-phosphate cytidylyltransferase [Oscillospiraceae bacterium]
MSLSQLMGAPKVKAQKPKEKTAALILAAGSSTRMGGTLSKQFLSLCGAPVLAHTLLAFQKTPRISEIIVAARPEDFDEIAEIRRDFHITKLHTVVAGGKNRQESARRAFAKVSDDVTYVAIADGARCLITPEEITNVCLSACRYKAASAARRINGTVKRTNYRGAVLDTVDRTNLWEAQTPQIFHVALYSAALAQAEKDKLTTATDDNSLVENLGARVQMVECSPENIKITTPEDLSLATAILTMRQAAEEENEK